MKMSWKRSESSNKKRGISHFPNLPFSDDASESRCIPVSSNSIEEAARNDIVPEKMSSAILDDDGEILMLAKSYQDHGNRLAEDGKYREALGKWESALTLMPERAVLHEQKAQILLELGDAWNALKAATRATELEPTWTEAWIALGRAQLNFGEPDCAIESFDKALVIKPHSVEASNGRQTALTLVRKRKQLHSSGLGMEQHRFAVGDKTQSS